MKLLKYLAKLFQQSHPHKSHSESALRYAVLDDGVMLKTKEVQSVSNEELLDAHLEKRIDFYADKHPTLLVRLLAIRLRQKNQRIDDLNKILDTQLKTHRDTICRLEAKLEYSTQKLVEYHIALLNKGDA